MNLLNIEKIKKEWPKAYEKLKNRVVVTTGGAVLPDQVADVVLSSSGGIISLLDEEQLYIGISTVMEDGENKWYWKEGSYYSERFSSRQEAMEEAVYTTLEKLNNML